jgi:hypothetical protein
MTPEPLPALDLSHKADQFLAEHREKFGYILSHTGKFNRPFVVLFFKQGWFHLRQIERHQPGKWRHTWTKITLGDAFRFYQRSEKVRPFPELPAVWMRDRPTTAFFDNSIL